jgi:Protein of unknown function (DUF3102)
LEEAKGLLKHGQWLPWLQGNCGISERTAQRYMRPSRNSNKFVTDGGFGIAAADRLLASTGNLDIDLSGGAMALCWTPPMTILIKPCGSNGKYAGWYHIIITHHDASDEDNDTMVRTVEAVRESEIVPWLRQHGGVDVDAVKWHCLSYEPEPDTYRRDCLLERHDHYWVTGTVKE